MHLRHRLARDLFRDDRRRCRSASRSTATSCCAALVELQYQRNDLDFYRGTFRVRGDSFELFPAHLEDRAWRFSLFGDEIEASPRFDPLTGEKTAALDAVKIYANSHYVTPKPTLPQAVKQIKDDLKDRLGSCIAAGQAAGGAAAGAAHAVRPRDDRGHRLAAPASRTIRAISPAASRASRRRPCSSICPSNALLIVDESHVTVPQLGGMFSGDCARKIDAGRIRLPPAVLHRQPPAQVRGMGRDAAADRLRLGDARPVGAGAHRRRLHRAGDPPDRPDRSGRASSARPKPGRRPDRRVQGRAAKGSACWSRR